MEPKTNLGPRDVREVSLGKITREASPRKKIEIEDLCDLSVFGLSPVKNRVVPTSKQPLSVSSVKDAIEQRSSSLFSNSSSPTSFNVDDFCDLTSFGIGSHNETNKRTKDHGFELNRADSELGQQETYADVGRPKKTCSNEDFDLNDFVRSTKRNDPSLSGSSQSQLPITQLLSLINRGDGSPSASGHQEKIGTPMRKQKLSVKAVQSPSPAKSQVRKNLNKSFNRIVLADSTNSDDDFDERPPSPVFRKPKPTLPHTSNRKTEAQNRKTSQTRPAKRKKEKNPFVEDEAELSEDEAVHVSEDEEEEEKDQSVYETSVVADETQHVDTQMHARYLQSLMSPGSRTRGQFKIPQRPKFNVNHIYSQEVSNEDDNSLEDSFVVDEEVEQTQQELSQLDILEQKLKEQRKKRKKSEGNMGTVKQRLIMRLSDDSD